TTGASVAELCAPFDTVSVCFSKGLGAPVGSALCGSRAAVLEARRFRKMWGGGMRQSGILAAAALHALTHPRARPAHDHENARALAELLATVAGARVDLARVETNIVNVDLDLPIEAARVAERARSLGVAVNATGPQRLRAITHLDVTRDQVLRGAALLGDAI